MATRGPKPPFEYEPTDETEKKYGVGAILVAIFMVVVVTVAIIAIATQPGTPDVDLDDVPTGAPADN